MQDLSQGPQCPKKKKDQAPAAAKMTNPCSGKLETQFSIVYSS